MIRSNLRSPSLGKERLNSVPRRGGDIRPGHIESKQFKLLDRWVAPMILYAGLDITLTDIHHGWFPPTMPDDVNALAVVEVRVLKVNVVELAPNLALALRPDQIHLVTSM